MSSVQYLRELINERLTAAAEEIFRVFQKTIVEYEEEIDRQRRLLDIVWKPEIKLHRIELPQQHVCKEEEVLADQQLCKQERNSGLDQEDPEPPQIKEEQEELCTSLEGEQLVLKQETETFMSIPTCEESDNGENPTLDCAAEKERVVRRSVKSSAVPEPNSDNQLPSHNSHVTKGQDTGSTRNAEPKPQKGQHNSNSHTNSEYNSTTFKIHSNRKWKTPLKCDAYQKNFEQKFKLDRHQRIHTGEKPYSCKTCGRGFRFNSWLLAHMRTHTGEKPHLCNICGKRFNDISGLKRHTRIHTGERLYPCKTCGKGFRCSSGLLVHMRTHTGEKPYLCNTCGKRFNERSKLKRHMRIHTDERPYPCNTCGKTFSDLSLINRHMKTHTGERPYVCNTCGKNFSDMSGWKRHMRTHTGERPYLCNTCGKRFTQKSGLTKHIARYHTGEKQLLEKYVEEISVLTVT